MAGESGGDSATLETTPTWAVATVCFCLIAVSILIEHGLHILAKYLSRKRRTYLIHALNKIKSDLLLLGFISLLLTVCEKPIANICIPKGVAHSFLPCHSLTSEEEEESKCEEQDKLSLISRVGIQQLQLLIFFLAFFHVLSSFLTFSLGIAKMRRWEHWEAETRTLEYEFSNDNRRFQLIHQTSFGRRHLKFWSEHRLLRWPACFLRQFYGSVYKVDYFTLRHGFIVAHFAEESDFNFQKYLKRALEKDFGIVVGMRLWIWIFSVLFIFFNAFVFRNYFWLPFIPLLMLLIVGTKLQGIITKMCLDSSDKSHVVQGTLLVQPGDHLFWFDRPELLLHLMHLILFQNSFQLAFFVWSWYKFGLRSCFHRKTEDIVIKLIVGVVVNFLCGYVTLPLYALINQMGSSMRNSAFTEEVMGGLKRWRVKAKKNLAHKRHTDLARRSLDGLLDTSVESSPSCGTLDPSFSIEIDYASDSGVVSNENSVARRQPEQHQKPGSFEGFELSRTY
ncbi:MLO 6 [Olea europaea subsp. europaea]|uniref:MLO-like protein n=1 Tax=Olea europaea subsp. europaea TaxID=158383 RepID=A0A8S0S6D6_OLEEU|nr:MLO 6 [Olea europaea subsp. europaea]